MDNHDSIDDAYVRINDTILTIRVSEITTSYNYYTQREKVQINGEIVKRTEV